MTNSVDPDETAHYEPSHLDLHCLHKCLFGLKWLTLTALTTFVFRVCVFL